MNINKNKLPSPTDKILTEFVSQINKIQTDLIEGLYVTGSIPLGDYYLKKSDIDFIAILKEKPNEVVIKKIEKIHFKIEHKYNNPKLNGYYLTLEGLKNGHLKFPSFFEGKMQSERFFELDKVTLYELQTTSLNILGNPATDLLIKISFDDVVSQLYQNINTYWTTWIHKHSAFKIGFFFLALYPRLTEWGILGVARQFHTLESKKITSKHNAGLYCLDKLPKQYYNIISVAIEARKANKTQLRPSFERATKTIECMKYLIDEFNKTYNASR